MVKVPTEARVLADKAVKQLQLPSAYLRLRQAMGKLHSSLSDMAQVVARDPTLTAQVLKVVNSPFYGTPREIGSVPQAVSLLGMARVHDIALASSVSAAFDELDDGDLNLPLFWQRSMFAALAARGLAEACGADTDRSFVAGLLADIGHLVLYAVPAPRVQDALRGIAPWRDHTCAREVDALGFHHAHVGAALLDAWSLPDTLVDWVLRQDDPIDGGLLPDELCVTHMAGRLADAFITGAPVADALERMDPEAVAECRLGADDVEAVHGDAAQSLGESLRVIMPQFANAHAAA